MTDKEQNRSEVEQAPTPKDGSTGMNLRGKDRRRFIKRAIVAAPFILTVASRPVWACNCTMSGQLSGNLSDGNEPCRGQGCSPGYWKNHTHMWHYAFPPDETFSKVFGVNPFYPDNPTLYQVIDKYVGPNDPFEPLVLVLGFHAVAALQNAATSVSYDLTVDQVITEVNAAYTNYLSSGGGSGGGSGGRSGGDSVSDLEPLKNDLDFWNNQGSDLCGYDN